MNEERCACALSSFAFARMFGEVRRPVAREVPELHAEVGGAG
jgi:hypothetical protein